ncbi:MAG: hypothetical protein H0X08_08580, partial [Blastocatellia bacterium]|nr:hypothetical protein [Blastocatellia bacterium]
ASRRGDLASQNLLGQLAQEFGTAIGHYGSLRDAIGRTDEDGVWRPAKPDPSALARIMEPHARGSILVAAIFEAFLTIYKTRVADLLRIATNGTAVRPEGELHPDLVNRLADEAAKAASHVLGMCIRALDYCPPIDITFGDYLRAIITADHDLFPTDGRHYRLAFIDAFRRRGIFPQGVVTFSEDSLRFSRPAALEGELKGLLEEKIGDFLRDFRTAVTYVTDRKALDRIARDYVRGGSEQGLHKRIARKLESPEFEQLTGLVFRPEWDKVGVRTSEAYGSGPSFQVQNLRVVSRSGEPDSAKNMIVFALVQRCGVIVRDGVVAGHYVPDATQPPQGGFEFRGGCTMIFDLDTLQLRYSVTKPLLRFDSIHPQGAIDEKRVLAQHRYQRGEGLVAMDEHTRFFGRGLQGAAAEPFALLHLG